MRLTKYEPSDESMFPYKLKDEELSTELDSIHKLGRFEDIEEDLGVDLIKVFTANAIYYLDWNFENGKWLSKVGDLTIREADREYYGLSINVSGKFLELCNLDFGTSHYLDFSDYGKKNKYGGWAFTKEELE